MRSPVKARPKPTPAPAADPLDALLERLQGPGVPPAIAAWAAALAADTDAPAAAPTKPARRKGGRRAK